MTYGISVMSTCGNNIKMLYVMAFTEISCLYQECINNILLLFISFLVDTLIQGNLQLLQDITLFLHTITYLGFY